MIDLDIEQLRLLCGALRSASEQITEATGLLRKTVEHHNWGCRERVLINENSTRIKLAATELQQGCAQFTSAVVSTVDDFVAAETEINAMFGEVDDLLAGMMARNTAAGNSSGSSQAHSKDVLDSLLEHMDGADTSQSKTYDFENILGPLHSAPLKDLHFGGDR